jgi:hypothetical protein
MPESEELYMFRYCAKLLSFCDRKMTKLCLLTVHLYFLQTSILYTLQPCISAPQYSLCTTVYSDFILKNCILITHQIMHKLIHIRQIGTNWPSRYLQHKVLQQEDQIKNIPTMSVRYSTIRIHCQFKNRISQNNQ